MSNANQVTVLRNTYQIKILLQGIKPPVWRRLEVDSRITLDALHVAIQSCMGWLDCHQHQFVDQDQNIFCPPATSDEFTFDFEEQGIDETTVLLSDILHTENDWFTYEYDFGDSWQHHIILEEILPYKPEQLPVLCIKGMRACPPEDCGGSPGYMNMVKLLRHPETDPDEYQDIMEWLGKDFDPAAFDLEEVNEELTALFENADFNNTSAFEKVIKQVAGLNDTLEPSAPPDEFEELIGGLTETMAIIADMNDLLDEAYDAFKQIAQISQDKKVLAIANKMIKRLDE